MNIHKKVRGFYGMLVGDKLGHSGNLLSACWRQGAPSGDKEYVLIQSIGVFFRNVKNEYI